MELANLDLFGISNIVCAIAGATIFVFCISIVNQIITLFPQAKMTKNWKAIKVLIYFFLIGYVANILAVLLGLTSVVLMMQAFVYLFGAVFVYMVVSLSKRTYILIIETSKQ